MDAAAKEMLDKYINSTIPTKKDTGSASKDMGLPPVKKKPYQPDEGFVRG